MNFRLRNLYFLVAVLVFIPVMLILATLTARQAQALPQGVIKSALATNFNEPTDFEITSDGKIYITEKSGIVRVIKEGQTLPAPFVTLSANTQSERGLLGITLDPNYSTNKYVYLVYTAASPLEFRVSRFTDSSDVGINETILFATPINPSGATHMGGGIAFGTDGKIFFTTGDNTLGEDRVSQNLNSHFGKLLRINPDGSVPSDNPFYGQTDKKSEIWAYGFRNPFRFSIRGDGVPVVADVGGDFWEEVDLVEKGGNYGWPDCEGFNTGNCSNPEFKAPFFAYPHNGQSASITGGMYFTGDQLPQEFQGNYFYGDYVRGFIKRLTFDGSGNPVEQSFDDEAGTAVTIKQGPDGALYFITIYPGTLYKVYFSTENQQPTARINATPTYGDAPLTVNFSGTTSSDPENQPLTYIWDFGDGTNSTEENPVHTYPQNGRFSVKLIVNDGEKSSLEAVQVITVGDTAPVPTIISPVEGKTYNGGEIISIEGSATDKEEGELGGAAFSWEIIRYVDDFQEVHRTFTGQKNATWVTRSDGKRSANQRYEIKLTVKDASGLSTTVSRTIYPNVVTLTFTSDPVLNLIVNIDGIPFATPYVTDAVVNYKIPVQAVTPLARDGISYQFDSWSDGGTISHQLIVPAANTMYISKYISGQTGNRVLKNSVIAGDVKLNGKALYDNDPSSGLVVLIEEDADYEAPWGATVMPNDSPESAQETFERVVQEIKNNGCGTGCASVVSFRWPSETPPEKIVNMSAGEKRTFAPNTVIIGDIKINGKAFYDNFGNTGLAVLLEQEAEIEAEWGAMAVLNDDMQSGEAELQKSIEQLKINGCGSSCSEVAGFKWPSQQPKEKIVALSPGQSQTFEANSVVVGDVKVNGVPYYDSNENSGLVIVLLQEAEVGAEWGATVYRTGSIGEARALQSSIADALKQLGCNGRCSSVVEDDAP